MVQGHVGDVPMHRLSTQLLLSSEIHYFSPETSAGAHRNSAAGILGEEGAVQRSIHSISGNLGILGRFWLRSVRSHLQNDT